MSQLIRGVSALGRARPCCLCCPWRAMHTKTTGCLQGTVKDPREPLYAKHTVAVGWNRAVGSKEEDTDGSGN